MIVHTGLSVSNVNYKTDHLLNQDMHGKNKTSNNKQKQHQQNKFINNTYIYKYIYMGNAWANPIGPHMRISVGFTWETSGAHMGAQRNPTWVPVKSHYHPPSGPSLGSP